MRQSWRRQAIFMSHPRPSRPRNLRRRATAFHRSALAQPLRWLRQLSFHGWPAGLPPPAAPWWPWRAIPVTAIGARAAYRAGSGRRYPMSWRRRPPSFHRLVAAGRRARQAHAGRQHSHGGGRRPRHPRALWCDRLLHWISGALCSPPPNGRLRAGVASGTSLLPVRSASSSPAGGAAGVLLVSPS